MTPTDKNRNKYKKQGNIEMLQQKWMIIFHADHSMFLGTEARVSLLKSPPEFHRGQFSVPSYSWYI